MMAGNSPARQSQPVSPLFGFANWLESVKGGTSDCILVPSHIYQAVIGHLPSSSEHYNADEADAIVHALDDGHAALFDRLDAQGLGLLCRIFIYTGQCFAQFRGLCLLANSLYFTTYDPQRRQIQIQAKKEQLGSAAMIFLVKGFINTKFPEQTRRWIGVLALELLKGCASNFAKLQTEFNQTWRGLDEVMIHGKCQVLKILAGSMIREMLCHGVPPESFWRTGIERNLYAKFPKSEHHDSQWILAFEIFLQDLESAHTLTQEKSNVIFVHYALIGDEQYSVRDEFAILVTISEFLSIVIPASLAGPAKYIDIPLVNITKFEFDNTFNTQSQEPTYGLLIRLSGRTTHSYYVDALGQTGPFVGLAFKSEKDARSIIGVIRPEQYLSDKQLPVSHSQPIDISHPPSKDELTRPDLGMTHSQDLVDTASCAAALLPHMESSQTSRTAGFDFESFPVPSRALHPMRAPVADFVAPADFGQGMIAVSTAVALVPVETQYIGTTQGSISRISGAQPPISRQGSAHFQITDNATDHQGVYDDQNEPHGEKYVEQEEIDPKCPDRLHLGLANTESENQEDGKSTQDQSNCRGDLCDASPKANLNQAPHRPRTDTNENKDSQSNEIENNDDNLANGVIDPPPARLSQPLHNDSGQTQPKRPAVKKAGMKKSITPGTKMKAKSKTTLESRVAHPAMAKIKSKAKPNSSNKPPKSNPKERSNAEAMTQDEGEYDLPASPPLAATVPRSAVTESNTAPRLSALMTKSATGSQRSRKELSSSHSAPTPRSQEPGNRSVLGKKTSEVASTGPRKKPALHQLAIAKSVRNDGDVFALDHDDIEDSPPKPTRAAPTRKQQAKSLKAKKPDKVQKQPASKKISSGKPAPTSVSQPRSKRAAAQVANKKIRGLCADEAVSDADLNQHSRPSKPSKSTSSLESAPSGPLTSYRPKEVETSTIEQKTTEPNVELDSNSNHTYLQSQIQSLNKLVPQCSARACEQALLKRQGNIDDAFELLGGPEDPTFPCGDLVVDENEGGDGSSPCSARSKDTEECTSGTIVETGSPEKINLISIPARVAASKMHLDVERNGPTRATEQNLPKNDDDDSPDCEQSMQFKDISHGQSLLQGSGQTAFPNSVPESQTRESKKKDAPTLSEKVHRQGGCRNNEAGNASTDAGYISYVEALAVADGGHQANEPSAQQATAQEPVNLKPVQTTPVIPQGTKRKILPALSRVQKDIAKEAARMRDPFAARLDSITTKKNIGEAPGNGLSQASKSISPKAQVKCRDQGPAGTSEQPPPPQGMRALEEEASVKEAKPAQKTMRAKVQTVSRGRYLRHEALKMGVKATEEQRSVTSKRQAEPLESIENKKVQVELAGDLDEVFPEIAPKSNSKKPSAIFSQKQNLISFGSSGPRNQGTKSAEKPDAQSRPQKRWPEIGFAGHKEQIPTRKAANAGLSPPKFTETEAMKLCEEAHKATKPLAPAELDMGKVQEDDVIDSMSPARKRQKRGPTGTPPLYHKNPPRVQDAVPELRRAIAPKTSSQDTRVNENGSPMPFVRSLNDRVASQAIELKDDDVRYAFESAQVEDNGIIIQDQEDDMGPPQLPDLMSTSAPRGTQVDFGLMHCKQRSSSRPGKLVRNPLPSPRPSQNRHLLNGNTQESFVPAKSDDPFIGDGVSQSSSFFNLLLNSKNTKPYGERLDVNRVAPIQGRLLRNLPLQEDPDKTLVDAERSKRRGRRQDVPNSSSSPSSQTRTSGEDRTEGCSDDEDENDNTKSEWLQPHQTNMIDVLSVISHRLVRHLIDKEDAIEDIVNDYKKGSNFLLENYDSQRQAALDAFSNANGQFRAQRAALYSQTIADLSKNLEGARNGDSVKIVKVGWDRRQQDLTADVNAALAACEE